MEDNLFCCRVIIATPIVAHGIHIAVGIVVQFVIHTAVAVIVQHVITWILRRTHIQMMVINGGDTPEVAGYKVAAQLGGTGCVITINADSAAAVIRIHFQVVVYKLVIVNFRGNPIAVLRVAVAVVLDYIVLQ